jgi:hypothetical protein
MSDPARSAPFNGAPLQSPDDDLPEPPRLRTLRRLVTGLTMTLIAGVAMITGALVLRISGGTPASVPLDPARVTADAVVLPAGQRVTATGGSGTTVMLVTQGDDGIERLLLIDGETGAIRRTLTLEKVIP